MVKEYIKAKIYLIIVVAVIIIILGIILIKNPFNWNFNILGGELKIEKTENVIERVKKISEFTSMCYYEESVIKKHRKEATVLNSLTEALDMGGDSCIRELVIIAKGKVRAGFDFSKVKDNDIRVSSDSLFVTLPKAEILDVISNPSDYQVYHEDGKWSHEEVTDIQKSFSETIKQNALKDNILEKASKSGVEKLANIFNTFGYKEVILTIKE